MFSRRKRYNITEYTRRQARKHRVTIKHSKNPTKKIDVFKNGKRVASVGATGYGDYPTFWARYGKTFANKKRRLYKMRHQKDRTRRGTAGWYADKLLW